MGSADLGLVRRIVRRTRAHPPVITVIGDVILDRWVIGDAERLTREAPVPVVRVGETIDVPGGAANTAMNLAALGASVRMVALVGNDDRGAAMLALLANAGIDTSGITSAHGAMTTTKTRVVAGDRIVVRIDEEAVPPSAAHRRALAAASRSAAAGCDAVIVCDYALGLDPEQVIAAVQSARPRTVVVDAHDVTAWAALHADLVTPNHRETEHMLQRTLGTGTARVAAVGDARADVLARSGAAAAIVTLDRDGTVAIGDDLTRTRAVPASEQQASGAGDTFCAAATLALTCGERLGDAARFAQAAADVVVRESGTTVCTADALVASVEAPLAVVVDHDALADAVAEARSAGRTVVFTNGCFDVVHRGHTSYLRQARALGDMLIVAVNDDDSVRRLKGPQRPINAVEDRAGVLAALSSVDLVTVFATDTPIPLLERIQPDVYVKGGDYSPEMLAETEVVRRHGGEVVMVDWVPEHSTTAVVQRIRDASLPS